MIREYAEPDLDGLLDTWYQASLVAHPFLEAAFLEKEKESIRTIYIPNTKTWVYEEQGLVVGFIAMMGNEVGAIFVRPEKHGAGIGTQLMDLVAEIHGELEVEVFKRNSIGRAFYEKYGFVPIGESVHAETGNDVLRLRFVAP